MAFQPVINQQPVGNILLSAAILLSGGLFSTFYLFASLLNFAFIGKSTFYELQHRILWPVIDKAWHDHVGVVQMLAQGRALRLCGDARCDSPGYSATYGTYTLMDMLDGLICGFSLVQVTETDHNSGAMEKEGLRRLLLQLRCDGLNVSLLATDRSPQIRAMMRREFPTIKHQFDIWHFAKSVTKSCISQAKRRTMLLSSSESQLSRHTCGGQPATATGIQKCSARSGHRLSTTLPTSIHGLAMRCFISVNTVCYQMQIKLLGLTVLVLRRKPCERLCSTSNFWMTLANCLNFVTRVS